MNTHSFVRSRKDQDKCYIKKEGGRCLEFLAGGRGCTVAGKRLAMGNWKSSMEAKSTGRPRGALSPPTLTASPRNK